MKKTIVVNLFAGPGAGKSTGAAYIFSQLKMRGYDCEYVSEFAKDKVWEKNDEVFKCQFYVTGKQVFKISRCYGQVDIIITDSPIAIGAQYLKENETNLGLAILDEFNKYRNLNFFIKRVKDYNPNGRHQTESEAKKIDLNTKDWLKSNDIDFSEVSGNEEGYNQIIKIIEKCVCKTKRVEELETDCQDVLSGFLYSYNTEATRQAIVNRIKPIFQKYDDVIESISLSF